MGRDRAAVIRSIGYVPQGDSLFAELTVRHHVALAASLRGRFDERVASERLDAAGVSLGRRVGTLSGRQRAQVMLALALGTRAPVLLLDEPLASLDPLARRAFLRALPAAGDPSVSVGLASHNVGDIYEACQRIVVLGSGHVRLPGRGGARRLFVRMTQRAILLRGGQRRHRGDRTDAERHG